MANLLEELLVGIGIDTQELTAGASGAADEVESSLSGISGGVAGAAVGGLFMAGLTNAMDASAANTKLTNQLGLTEPEAARAGDAAGRVFSAGFGESIDEVSQALGAVTQNIGGMGNASNAELDQMTKDALALSDTFEFDVAESAQTAGTLMKTGMAKDGQEAFDLITAAAQKLPPALREELPALTNEYAEFFDQLGFTGPEMMGLFAQAAKDPTFQLDKLGDAVKEFSLRLSDTKAVEAPLKSLGLNVQDIQKLVNTGHGTKAFDEVTTALKGVDDQTERTKLQAQLFGGPGEDMGNTLLGLSAGGAAASTGMDKAAGSAKGVTDSVGASKSIDSIWRTMATTIGDTLAPALKIVSDFMKDNPQLISILTPILLGLAVAIGIAAIAQWAWNAALFASPVTWIIVAIIALIAIIVLIAMNWDKVKEATGKVWDWIVAKLSTAWTWIKAVVMAVWNSVTAKIGAAWEWIKGKVLEGVIALMGYVARIRAVPGQISDWFGKVLSWLSGLPGKIGRIASGMWDSISSNFRSAVNAIIGMWNNLSFTIGGGSVLGVSIPSMTLSTPNIPYLADGGVTSGPTLAMIGEGSEQEAVLPLSKLDGMMRSVAGAVRNTGGNQQINVNFNVDGSDSDGFKAWVRSMVATDAGGDAQRFFGGAA